MRIEQDLAPATIYEMYSSWANMALDMLDIPQAEACYTSLLRIGEQHNYPLLIGSAYSGMARVAGIQSKPRLALAHLDHAISFLRLADNLCEHIEAVNRRATMLVQLLKFREAAQAIETILPLEVQPDDPSANHALVEAYNQLGRIMTCLGRPRETRKYALLAQAVSRAFNHPGCQAQALANLGAADYLLDDYLQAIDETDQAIQLAGQGQDWRLRGYLYPLRAQNLICLGRLDEAWKDGQETLRIGTEYRFPESLSRGYCVLGDIFFVLRDFPNAVNAFRKGLDVTFDHISTMQCLFRLGGALVQNGQAENGLTFLHQAVELSAETGLEMVHLPAEFGLALAQATIGNLAEAIPLAEKAAKGLAERGGNALQQITHWVRLAAALTNAPETVPEYVRAVTGYGGWEQNAWIELAGLEYAAHLSGTDGQKSEYRIRIAEVLARLGKSITQPDILPAFQRLQESLYTI